MDHRALSGRKDGKEGERGKKVVNDLKSKVACEETNLSGLKLQGSRQTDIQWGKLPRFY